MAHRVAEQNAWQGALADLLRDHNAYAAAKDGPYAYMFGSFDARTVSRRAAAYRDQFKHDPEAMAAYAWLDKGRDFTCGYVWSRPH